MGSNVPTLRDTVLNVLREHGPMTRNAIAEFLDWPTERVHGIISNTRWLHPQKYFRVVGYKRVVDSKGKDMSLYSAEGGIDKVRHVLNAVRRKNSLNKYRKANRELLNSKSRAARAVKQNKKLPINPWYALAQPSIRSEMTQVMLRTKGTNDEKKET